MTIHIERRKLNGQLALATALFSALGIMVEIVSKHQESRGWLTLFDLDREWNFPTIYSALLFFIASAVLAMIAGETRLTRTAGFGYWGALSVIFLFLGLDELFSIHNSAKHLVPLWFKHIDLFKLRWDLRWVVIGIPAVVLIGLVFIPFVLRLPRRTACGIIIAGIIFVGASVGLEMFGGWWIGKYTRNNWTYSAEVVVEETLEMVGIVMFVGVLLAYAKRELAGRLRLGSLHIELDREARDILALDRSTR